MLDYKNDPRYRELASIVADGGSTEELEEYLKANGVINEPYDYSTPAEGIINIDDDEIIDNGLNNRYTNGMNFTVPEQYTQDYLNEFNKLSQDENYNPLLMYILQKNAQSGFKNGPIGTDGYYEAYDPEYNENLYEDFTDFIDTYYPDFDDRTQEMFEDSLLDGGYDIDDANFDPDNIDFDKMNQLDSYKRFKELNNLNYYRTNKIPQEFEVEY